MATVNVDQFGIDHSKFPPNTAAQRKPLSAESPVVKPPKVPVTKVVQGRVEKRKTSLGRRLTNTFIGDDTVDIKSYLVQEVIVPGIKEGMMGLLYGVIGGFEMKLFGTTRVRRPGYTPYSNASTNKFGTVTMGGGNTRPANTVRRSAYDIGDIVFESKGEADLVLDSMLEMLDTYGRVSVADMYELVGWTANFTDYDFGWTDLRSSDVRRVAGGGYTLILPRPTSLK